MGLHQYQVGQEVRFRPNLRQMGSRLDRYVIARILPADNKGYLQYQISPPSGGHALIVREDQISLRHPVDAI